MLFISSDAYRSLSKVAGGIKAEYRYVDEYDDLYRLLPNGDVYVHWLQENQEQRYSENGALIGNLNGFKKPGK